MLVRRGRGTKSDIKKISLRWLMQKKGPRKLKHLRSQSGPSSLMGRHPERKNFRLCASRILRIPGTIGVARGREAGPVGVITKSVRELNGKPYRGSHTLRITEEMGKNMRGDAANNPERSTKTCLSQGGIIGTGDPKSILAFSFLEKRPLSDKLP